VRACTLDHGTPVLAFALETTCALNIRKDRLAALGAPPGPWLTVLKRELVRGRLATPIALPNGSIRQAGDLAPELVLVTPGGKLAYATDLADTAVNRERLVALAAGAHTFICEATFVEEDVEQAMKTGHLTARACGEIATAARVERLVPFHFSDRYREEPARVYREVRAACLQAVTPIGW
jgi:ribonuclease BN (tRNA processing enzyme)